MSLKDKINNKDILKQEGEDFFRSFWLNEDRSFIYTKDVREVERKILKRFNEAFSRMLISHSVGCTCYDIVKEEFGFEDEQEAQK